ncbi:DUF5991 domain-containing protein [Phenylobacterium sp. VNQ135]|uniref:DUF5991 domain-containing protein n=1 Tax=Phenylobacterium sp. VNQ135 TaxID=3400922 RepID=UPI003C10EA4C
MKSLLLGVAVFGLAATAQAAPAWTGTYAFHEALGRDAVGTGITISVDHKLTVGPNSCRLTAEGYQTNTQIRCTAVPNGDRLVVNFVSFGDGSVANQYGVKLYQPGQPLFTLSRKGATLVTTWQGYKPNMDGNMKPGGYFKKTG